MTSVQFSRARVSNRRGHQAEIASAVVGDDVEQIAVVVDVILVLRRARRDHTRRGARLIGGDAVHLGGGGAVRAEEDPCAAARALHADAEARVAFLEHQRILARCRSCGGTAARRAWPHPPGRRTASRCRWPRPPSASSRCARTAVRPLRRSFTCSVNSRNPVTSVE